ncbi:hypothetical protein E1301_Tti016401 [Triplophysa tibetana]|uniref:Uncharacterized protein n=1 Tax=Triplophysa tibetana TaxID=1572043 RepID=A0A5A9MXL5_9TELE|nr:hypothetical protein E1301_Tti016401 [Triplophysa tibetana]
MGNISPGVPLRIPAYELLSDALLQMPQRVRVYVNQKEKHSCGILNPRGMRAYPFACHRASVVMRGKERRGARWLKAHLMRPAESDCLGMRR